MYVCMYIYVLIIWQNVIQIKNLKIYTYCHIEMWLFSKIKLCTLKIVLHISELDIYNMKIYALSVV